MAKILVIDDDIGTLDGFGMILRSAGYEVRRTPSGMEGFEILNRDPMDAVVSDLRLPDISGLELLRQIRSTQLRVPFVLVTAFASAKAVVTAMRLGAMDVLEKPVGEDELLRTIQTVLHPTNSELLRRASDVCDRPESYAAARWARALGPVLTSTKDPRTIPGWAKLIFASPGTLRNWCRTAGISPRHSLVFARLLRAANLSAGGKHKLENLLDCTDRRTVVGLLMLAGLGNSESEFPLDMEDFVRRQTLVRDPEVLFVVQQLLKNAL